MAAPRISIAMGTYNGARFLPEQLASFAEQERLPFELVVGDDGSTDDTLEILETFAATAPFPVHITRNKRNLGFADNFLQAAERCSGEWIAFSDQDDRWLPSKLARVSEKIFAHGDRDLMLVAHQLDAVDEALRPEGRRLPPLRRTRLVRRLRLPAQWSHGGCAMVFRASLARDFDWRQRPADPFDWSSMGQKQQRQLPHDRWICLLANALGSTLLLAESLGVFRRHMATVSGSHVVPVGEQLRDARRRGVADYEHGEAHARATADTLLQLAQAGASAAALSDAAAGYRKLARIQAGRAALHNASSPLERHKALMQLARWKAYFGDPFLSTGPRSLAKDVVLALAPALWRRAAQ